MDDQDYFLYGDQEDHYNYPDYADTDINEWYGYYPEEDYDYDQQEEEHQ